MTNAGIDNTKATGRLIMLSNQITKRVCAKSRMLQKGFSLMELLIVIAIIGILATIAYPSYTDYVKKTKRSDGALALMEAVQAMERCKSTAFAYTNCTLTGQQSVSPESYYSIALSPDPTASTFTIVATPQGTQSSDTECATMSIDHLGNRTSTPGEVDSDDNGCWP